MPTKSNRTVTPVKAKKPSKAGNKPKAPEMLTRLNGWVLDATYEQHTAVAAGRGGKAGDREFDLQVSWSQPQWSPEKHILFTMQARGLVTDSRTGAPVSVAEATYMSEFKPGKASVATPDSDDVAHMAQTSWPFLRDQLNSLFSLGLHHPPLPEALSQVVRAPQSQSGKTV